MKKYLYLILSILSVLIVSCTSENNKKNEMDSRVEEILKKMTLKEKVGQMSQIDIATFVKRVDPKGPFYGPNAEPQTLDKDSLQKYIVEYGIGSMFNIGGHGYTVQEWYAFIKEIQDYAAKTRLKIPILYGVDAMHGASLTVGATLFPQQLGMASTCNPSLMETVGEITAYEMRASNVALHFGPSLDLGKHPLWSRLYETFGEDVYLASKMGVSAVDGMEGRDNNISDKTKITTNIKHFVGYSFPLSGKDRTQAWIPNHFVREYFLPTFAEAIKAGAHTIILNSGEINGIPMHANKYWLTDVLRGELGFKGVLLSDWRDVEKLQYLHHVAPTYKEAIKMAIDAGIDMNMVPYDNTYMDLLMELVNEGKISEERINTSVRRILKLKIELGLFEHPYRDIEEYPDFGSEKFKKVAKQSALESMILLKNSGNILPLAKHVKVLVTGPAANTMQALNGGWTYSWQGNAADRYAGDKNTILEAIINKMDGGDVSYVEGAGFQDIKDIDNAIRQAKRADYIILCLGEEPYAETPGYIDDIYLPDAQAELAKAMAATGKPVILLLSEGRPRLISKFEDKMAGIILSFCPGNEGGDAFADVLFGDYNPGGKLPVTYPKYPNNLINYDCKYSDMPDHNFGYELGYNPQFPFGYGLSYTTFEYTNLKIANDTINRGDTITISVDIKNTGSTAGQEVVQVYIRDLYAHITPPIRRLRAFEKISLNPLEQKTVSFAIKTDALKYVGLDEKWTIEEGEFEVYVNKLKGSFYLKK
jgi:beta-glucosidase